MTVPGALTIEDLRWLRALGRDAVRENAPPAVLSKLMSLKLATQGSRRIELTAKGRIAVRLLG